MTHASGFASAGSVKTADYEAYGYDAAGNRISCKRDGSTLTRRVPPTLSRIVNSRPNAHNTT